MSQKVLNLKCNGGSTSSLRSPREETQQQASAGWNVGMGPKGECERPAGIGFLGGHTVNDQVSPKEWKPIWPRAEIMTATGKQNAAFPSVSLPSLTSTEKMKGWWGAVREASRPRH